MSAQKAEAADDAAAWRARFVRFYEQKAPDKVQMVSDAMMEKWTGRYDVFYGNLEKKYGALGSPAGDEGAAEDGSAAEGAAAAAEGAGDATEDTDQPEEGGEGAEGDRFVGSAAVDLSLLGYFGRDDDSLPAGERRALLRRLL